jgi:hypothetical protein
VSNDHQFNAPRFHLGNPKCTVCGVRKHEHYQRAQRSNLETADVEVDGDDAVNVAAMPLTGSLPTANADVVYAPPDTVDARIESDSPPSSWARDPFTPASDALRSTLDSASEAMAHPSPTPSESGGGGSGGFSDSGSSSSSSSSYDSGSSSSYDSGSSSSDSGSSSSPSSE